MAAMAALPSSSHEKRSTTTNMDEIAVVLRKFGDEQSTLLDQFERLSFEVQLNQAILRRSFSEPGTVSKSKAPGLLPLVNSHYQPQVVTKPQKKRKGGRGRGRVGSSQSSGFSKLLKKLLKHIFVKKGSSSSSSNNINNNGARNHELPDAKNPKFCKAFSRSLRL